MADDADLAILTDRLGRLSRRDDPAQVLADAADLRDALVDLLVAAEARTGALLAEGRADALVGTAGVTVDASAALVELATSLERRAAEWDGADRVGALTEAVAVRRALAERVPDTAVAGLVAALDDLGIALGAAGHTDEGLAASTEAASLHRRLADDDPRHRVVLVRSVRGLALRLRAAGRPDDALALLDEAVDLLRDLARADPALLPGLAASLGNRSATLRDLDRFEEAVADGRASVERYRDLAARDPALRAHLADALHNLALACTDGGSAPDALVAAEESVAVRRALAVERPASVDDELARSLRLLAARNRELGRTDEALAAVTEAADEYARLGGDDAAGERAYCLVTAAMLAAETGRDERAVASFTEAIDAFGHLADERPDPHLRNTVTALFGLSRHHAGAGRDDAAFETIADAVNLVADRPEAAARVLSDTMAAGILAAYDEIAAATGRPRRGAEQGT